MAWRGSRAGWTIKRSVMKPTILNGLKHPLRSARRLRDKLSFSYAEHFEPEDFVGIPANRALSETKYYVSFVTQAVENYKVFSRFKSDPRYRAVLEHVSPQVGADYLSIIRQQTPELLDDFDRFKVNDIVGSPLTHVFPAIGECSPTTLRYVKVASDLKVYFGSDIGSHIAEIGVGYGGQLLINDQIFKMRECHLYDIPPVLGLVKKYLESHILNCAYKTTTHTQSAGDDYDLVISNYAFSELPTQLQHKYIDKVLSRSKRGYLAMNSGRNGAVFSGQLTVDELRQRLPKFEIIEDRPFPDTYIIRWGGKG